MPLPKTIVHLLSGGIDSVVMLYDLREQGHVIHCVLFDYKQRHVQELIWAKHHCQRLNVPYTTLEIPELAGSTLTDGRGDVVVPNRNAIFLSLAVNVAVAEKAEAITFAANKDDHTIFPDCRLEFVDAMNAVVKWAGYKVEIFVPYIDEPKWRIVAKGQDMGINFDETWSCYEGGLEPCGKCLACTTRASAFATRCVPFSV